MGLFSPSAQNPLGLHPGRAERVRAKMRGSAGSRGNIVYFDLAASDGAVTASTVFGGATDPLSNVILATATHDGTAETTAWIFGILAEDIVDDNEGWVYIRGVVQALITLTPNAGVGLKPMVDSELGVIVDKSIVVAITLETGVDAALGWVIFDGINKLGYQIDVP